MATKTKIEWTDYSWNPVTGCTEADIGGLLVKMPEIDGRVWDEYPRSGL